MTTPCFPCSSQGLHGWLFLIRGHLSDTPSSSNAGHPEALRELRHVVTLTRYPVSVGWLRNDWESLPDIHRLFLVLKYCGFGARSIDSVLPCEVGDGQMNYHIAFYNNCISYDGLPSKYRLVTHIFSGWNPDRSQNYYGEFFSPDSDH